MSVKIIKDSPIQLVDDYTLRNKNLPIENEKLKSVDKLVNDTVEQGSSLVDANKKAEVVFKQDVENSENSENSEKNEKSELKIESDLISDAMKTISEFISMPVRTVNFTQDDGSEKTVIKIYDSASNELIKQFPSEEILLIAQRIVELQQDISQKTGILLDESI
jgi:flagellar protein FlaG